MDAARAAVSKITGRTGHRTDVDEVVNAAVVSETIKPHRHEETQEAIDREVHQHHYHTTVQPIAAKETLPEKHVHNVLPQVEREFRHDNEAETHRRVSAELGQFQNTSTTVQTTHSTAAAATVAGEHVHHHVHETVQPIIHKEVVQPEVIHTVVPIHEVHHAGATHHGISALPMKTLDEFTRAGGLVTGSKSHTHEEYEGAPRPYNEKLMTTIEKVIPGHHHSGTSGTTGTGLTGRDSGVGMASGPHSSSAANKLDPRVDSDRDGRSGLSNTDSRGTSGFGTSGQSGYNSGSTGTHGQRDFNLGTTQSSDRHHNSSSGKPSLMDRLNPKTDTDRDGKTGFME